MAFEWESNPPMFIVCSPRSGSTLLRLLLNTHSKISIPPPGFMYAHFHTFMHTYGNLKEDGNLRAFVEDVVEFHHSKVWTMTFTVEEIMEHVQERSFRGVNSAVHELWAHRHGKIRWGEKSPRDVYWIGQILEDYPNAQFLNIFRDGRAVAVDWVDNLDWPNNIYSTALDWKRHTDAVKPWRTKLSDKQFLDIRYEDMVTDPPKKLAEICAFLGVEYEPEMLSYYDSPEAGKWSQSEACHQYVAQPITTAYIDAWKKRLEPLDRQMLAGLIGQELRDLGYEVEDKPRALSEEERNLYVSEASGGTIETYRWYVGTKKRRAERLQKGIWSDKGRSKAFG
ncbi:MAG: sulfotransferase [Rhodospirillales bacterium]